jgi:hypothetical protein
MSGDASGVGCRRALSRSSRADCAKRFPRCPRLCHCRLDERPPQRPHRASGPPNRQTAIRGEANRGGRGVNFVNFRQGRLT